MIYNLFIALSHRYTNVNMSLLSNLLRYTFWFFALGLVLYNIISIYTYLESTSVDIGYIKAKINTDNKYFDNILIDEVSNIAKFYHNGSEYSTSISKRSDFSVVLSDLYNNSDYNAFIKVSYNTNKGFMDYINDAIIYLLVTSFILWLCKFFFWSNVSIEHPSLPDDDIFKLNNNDTKSIKFEDVIGQKEAKDDLNECIKYFKYREKYIEAGYKIPKGLLFLGQPGTGKTLLAKAFSNEAGVNFIPACGSDFNEIFVGVGSKRIRNLFSKARENAPCIIFIDEIDAIGGKRDALYAGNTEGASTLNKLLSEMDGFTQDDNIMVIGATNRRKQLDDALMRSGRFDKEIVFDLPNVNERSELFEMYMRKIKLDKSVTNDKFNVLKELSRMTAGLSGADIKNICNQSVANYLKRVDIDNNDLNGVLLNDLKESIDIVMIGMKKPERIITNDEKERVSFHEAGHCLIAYMTKNSEPPIKVSIIPRGQAALGFSQQKPSDRKLLTSNELLNKMHILLGGRTAEKIIYNNYSTGAYDDIEKLTEIAYKYVGEYGMISTIGPMNQIIAKKYISNSIKDKINNEVNTLIIKAETYVMGLLSKHQDELNKVAKYLLDNEVLYGEDLDELLEEYSIKNIY